MASELKSRKKRSAAKKPAAKRSLSTKRSARRTRALTLDERLLQLTELADKALWVAQEGRLAAEAAERKADKKGDKALHLADKMLRAAEADRARIARLDREFEEGRGHRNNLALALEQEFVAGLPRAMAAHGILIAVAAVQLRAQRSPERLEYDFVAPNGEVVLVGEVKTRLRAGDVAEMVGRLQFFREDYPEYAGLKLHGVVAGWAVDNAALALAKEKGFFVLRMDGAEIHPALGKDFHPTAY